MEKSFAGTGVDGDNSPSLCTPLDSSFSYRTDIDRLRPGNNNSIEKQLMEFTRLTLISYYKGISGHRQFDCCQFYRKTRMKNPHLGNYHTLWFWLFFSIQSGLALNT